MADACSAVFRFIPARAGNTSCHSAIWCACTVHPRAGGEHSSRNRLIQRIYFDDKERTRIGATGFRDLRGGSRPRNCILILHIVVTEQGKKLHELQAVQVHGNASIIPARVEIVACIVSYGPRDDAVSIANLRFHLPPDHLARSPRVVADVDTCPDLRAGPRGLDWDRDLLSGIF